VFTRFCGQCVAPKRPIWTVWKRVWKSRATKRTCISKRYYFLDILIKLLCFLKYRHAILSIFALTGRADIYHVIKDQMMLDVDQFLNWRLYVSVLPFALNPNVSILNDLMVNMVSHIYKCIIYLKNCSKCQLYPNLDNCSIWRRSWRGFNFIDRNFAQ